MNLRKTLAINSIGILNYLLKILRAINARTLSVVTRVKHNYSIILYKNNVFFLYINKCYISSKQLYHESQLKLPRFKIQEKIF